MYCKKFFPNPKNEKFFFDEKILKKMPKLNFPIHFIEFNSHEKIYLEDESLNIKRHTYSSENEFKQAMRDGDGVFEWIYSDQEVKQLFKEILPEIEADDKNIKSLIDIIVQKKWGPYKYKCFQSHEILEAIEFFVNY